MDRVRCLLHGQWFGIFFVLGRVWICTCTERNPPNSVRKGGAIGNHKAPKAMLTCPWLRFYFFIIFRLVKDKKIHFNIWELCKLLANSFVNILSWIVFCFLSLKSFEGGSSKVKFEGRLSLSSPKLLFGLGFQQSRQQSVPKLLKSWISTGYSFDGSQE